MVVPIIPLAIAVATLATDTIIKLSQAKHRREEQERIAREIEEERQVRIAREEAEMAAALAKKRRDTIFSGLALALGILVVVITVWLVVIE